MYKQNLIMLLSCICLMPAWGQENKLEYRRDNSQSNPETPRRPRAEQIPSELVFKKPQRQRRIPRDRINPNKPQRNNPNQKPDSNQTDKPTREIPVTAVARDAAEEMGKEMARDFGYREYYRIGFYRAMRQSLANGYVSRWDYRQGQRLGAADPQVRRDAELTANKASESMAGKLASDFVTAQFRDLSREPRRDPRAGLGQRPAFDAQQTAYQPPSLQGLFGELPPSRYGDWGAADYKFYENWRPDPISMHKARSWREVYDGRWRKVDYAFKHWTKDRKNLQYYQGLNQESKDRFNLLFKNTFTEAVDWYFHKYTLKAYDIGFQDGWGYGCFINEELSFRQGYHEAANQRFIRTAQAAYNQAFDRDYTGFYHQSFDKWANNPVVELEDARLIDANEDGVFEPGETLTLYYRATNYGGASAQWDLSLNSPILSRKSRARAASIPARSASRDLRGPAYVISEQTQAKTTHKAGFQLGELTRDLNLYVSWPLEINQTITVRNRNNLTGSAELVAVVHNQSAKNIKYASLSMNGSSQRIRNLAPGKQTELRFNLNGVRPIDLLGGDAPAQFRITRDGKTRDQLSFSPEEQVTDLQNRDLLLLLLKYADDPSTPNNTIAKARQLLDLRLRADWRQAARARGNPYRKDSKKNTRQTALGDLVQTWLEHKDELSNSRVFNDLEPRLLTLAKDLPGFHPFLRKHFRRLVKKLN